MKYTFLNTIFFFVKAWKKFNDWLPLSISNRDASCNSSCIWIVKKKKKPIHSKYQFRLCGAWIWNAITSKLPKKLELLKGSGTTFWSNYRTKARKKKQKLPFSQKDLPKKHNFPANRRSILPPLPVPWDAQKGLLIHSKYICVCNVRTRMYTNFEIYRKCSDQNLDSPECEFRK